MKTALVITLLFACFYDALSLGTVYNDGTLIMEFDDTNVNEEFECQQCYGFKLTDDAADTWDFRTAYRSFLELDPSGEECCSSIQTTGCDAGICNLHAIDQFPPEMDIKNNVSVYSSDFSGVYDSSVNPNVPSSCNPPGDGSTIFCGNFKFSSVILTEEANVLVANNVTVNVSSHTIQNSFHMDTWDFAKGSSGMRVVLMFSVNGAESMDWRLYPENSPATSPQVGGFNALGIETRTRIATVLFPAVGRINGTTVGVPLNISGPYPHEFDLDARYFYIESPPFHSLDYIFFTRVEPENLLGGASSLTASVLLTMALLLINFM